MIEALLAMLGRMVGEFNNLTRGELMDAMRQRNIEGRSKIMRKDDMIQALETGQGPGRLPPGGAARSR